MPNRHETLTSLFTDIADAIREKTGENTVLKADNFDTAIENIPVGRGQFTTEELLGLDKINSLTYTGTTLPAYSLARKKFGTVSLPNLKKFNDNMCEYTQVDDTNSLVANVEELGSYSLQHLNDSITLQQDYVILFPKLTKIYTANSWSYFGNSVGTTYKDKDKPRYVIIAPNLTTCATNYYGLAYFYSGLKAIVAPKFKCYKNVAYYAQDIQTIDCLGWDNAGTGATSTNVNFYYCCNLRTLVLRSTTMCPAATDATYMWSSGSNIAYFMTGTTNTTYNPNGEHGVIYVPDNLVDTYKNDANWQTCFDVNYIKPLSEYVDPYESYYQGE